MALDWQKMSWAGNAPIGSLNVGGNNRANVTGNPFAGNSQEFQEYEQRYNALPQSQGGSIPDSTYLANQQIELRKQANQPIATALQGQVPETKAAYQKGREQINTQAGLLDQKYQNLLDTLTQRENKETTTATTNLSREYGKRGVAGGAYDQALEQTLQPITQGYNVQMGGVTNDRAQSAEDLANIVSNLSTGESSDLSKLALQIAELQAGNPSESISQGLGLYQQNQANTLAQADLQLRQKQSDLNAQLQQAQLDAAKTTDPIQRAYLQAQVDALKQQTTFNAQNQPSSLDLLKAQFGLTNAQAANYNRQASGQGLSSGGGGGAGGGSDYE